MIQLTLDKILRQIDTLDYDELYYYDADVFFMKRANYKKKYKKMKNKAKVFKNKTDKLLNNETEES